MNELESMLAQYHDMMTELKPALQQLKDLESKIKAYALENNEVAEVDGASVTLRSGYVRENWDSKGLVGYAVANPEILEFCKQYDVKPSAAIKVKV